MAFNHKRFCLGIPYEISQHEEDKVEFDLCCGTFSIGHGGKHDIDKHINTKKHRDALVARSSSKRVDNYFSRQVMGDKEKTLACQEGTLAYHTIQHNHSFRSMDCTSTQNVEAEIYMCANEGSSHCY